MLPTENSTRVANLHVISRCSFDEVLITLPEWLKSTRATPRTSGPFGRSGSKLSGLAFLEYEEVVVSKEATEECPGLCICAGGYTLFRKAAVSHGVGVLSLGRAVK